MDAQIQGITKPQHNLVPVQNYELIGSVISSSEAATATVHPWARYWARLIDNFIFGSLLLIPLGFVYLLIPRTFMTSWFIIVNIIILFMYTFVEALLLSTWGTTPGKALLRIRLCKSNGAKLTYGEAWSRSLKVFVKGMGLGIPVIAFFTLLKAQSTLTQESRTSWDREGDFTVTHQTIGLLRASLAVLIILIIIGLRLQLNRASLYRRPLPQPALPRVFIEKRM